MRRSAPMKSLPVLLGLALLAACDSKSASPTSPPTAPKADDHAMMAPPASTGAAPKGETTYFFGVKETHTNITFQSKNDLTDILGASHHVIGSATIDFAAGAGTCQLTVPSVTLNSGMADRDNAMRGATWLNVKQFPNIEFKGEKASIVEAPNLWKIEGKFTLRGVTKDLSVTAKVRSLPASIG